MGDEACRSQPRMSVYICIGQFSISVNIRIGQFSMRVDICLGQFCVGEKTWKLVHFECRHISRSVLYG